MKLLDRIREHLDMRDRTVVQGRLLTDRQGRPADLELEAATAVLLLEAAYGDSEYVWSEHQTILRGLERSFAIGREEALSLMERANEIRPPIIELAEVTALIQERYDVDQRMEVVSILWQVVEADEIIEVWEDLFANHVATAVGLSVEQANEARQRAHR